MSSGAERTRRILDRLSAIVERSLGIEDIRPDMRLGPDLGVDSLGMIELVVQVEDEFGIEFEREDTLALETVADVVDFVSTRGA